MAENDIIEVKINYEDVKNNFIELLREYEYMDKFYNKSNEIYQAPHSRNLRKVKNKIFDLLQILEDKPAKMEKINKSLPKEIKQTKKTSKKTTKKTNKKTQKGGNNDIIPPQNNIIPNQNNILPNQNNVFVKSTEYNYNDNDTLEDLETVEPINNKSYKEIQELIKKLGETKPNEKNKHDVKKLNLYKNKIELLIEKFNKNFNLNNMDEEYLIVYKYYDKLLKNFEKHYYLSYDK